MPEERSLVGFEIKRTTNIGQDEPRLPVNVEGSKGVVMVVFLFVVKDLQGVLHGRSCAPLGAVQLELAVVSRGCYTTRTQVLTCRQALGIQSRLSTRPPPASGGHFFRAEPILSHRQSLGTKGASRCVHGTFLPLP